MTQEPTDTSGQPHGDSPAPGSPPPDDLRRALKAFKKRLKLTRLEDESKLGGGPMSSGAKSDIVAITPPSQFSKAVWDALVDQPDVSAQYLRECVELDPEMVTARALLGRALLESGDRLWQLLLRVLLRRIGIVHV